MAITVGNTGQPGINNNDSPQSFSFTVDSGSNSVLVVPVGSRRKEVNQVRYDGVDLTRIFGCGQDTTSNAVQCIHISRMLNPPVGTADVSAQHTTDSDCRPRPGAIVLHGVKQDTPNRTPATDTSTQSSTTSFSKNIPSEVGDLVIDIATTRPDATQIPQATAGSGQTRFLNFRPDYPASGVAPVVVASYKAGAATQTNMAWSGPDAVGYIHGGVAFIPATTSSGVSGTLSIQEESSDVLSANGFISIEGITGLLSVTEEGEDSFSSSGHLDITSTLQVQEIENDIASVVAEVRIYADLGIQESESDILELSGNSFVIALLEIVEEVSDTVQITGTAQDDDFLNSPVKTRLIEEQPSSQIEGRVPSNLIQVIKPSTEIMGTIPSSKVDGEVPCTKIDGVVPKTQIEGASPSTKITGDVPKIKIETELW